MLITDGIPEELLLEHFSKSPGAWLLATIGVLGIVAAIAQHETFRAQRIRRRNPGSLVWAVHLPRSTRYLVLSNDELGLLRGSGKGPRWPLDLVRRASAEAVQFPRAMIKQPGLIIDIGDHSLGLHDHYEVIFPRLLGFAGSAMKAQLAHEAINAAKARHRHHA